MREREKKKIDKRKRERQFLSGVVDAHAIFLEETRGRDGEARRRSGRMRKTMEKNIIRNRKND